jgi:hypothetical protein
MVRKRDSTTRLRARVLADSTLSKQDRTAEGVLRRVITALDTSDELNHPSHRDAVRTLLVSGPLFCNDAFRRELEQPDPQVSLYRAEFIKLLRDVVRARDTGHLGLGIFLHSGITFSPFTLKGRVVLAADGPLRELALLQLLLLLDQVGLGTVRPCEAGDCRRIFVKTYRREFCSLKCQRRAIKRRLRQAAREQSEKQQARARQRRRAAAKG